MPSGIFVLHEPLDKFGIFVVTEDKWFAGIEFADSGHVVGREGEVKDIQ